VVLLKQAVHLRTTYPDSYGIALPYAFFIAEYLSLSYRDGEHRDVCIDREGEVFCELICRLGFRLEDFGQFSAGVAPCGPRPTYYSLSRQT